MGLVLLFHPGNPETKQVLGAGTTEERNVDIVDNFLDLGRNLFPDNIFKASFQTAHTKYSEVPNANGTELARQLGYRYVVRSELAAIVLLLYYVTFLLLSTSNCTRFRRSWLVCGTLIWRIILIGIGNLPNLIL